MAVHILKEMPTTHAAPIRGNMAKCNEMAYYLVRARPHWAKLADLRARLDAGEIAGMQPR